MQLHIRIYRKLHLFVCYWHKKYVNRFTGQLKYWIRSILYTKHLFSAIKKWSTRVLNRSIHVPRDWHNTASFFFLVSLTHKWNAMERYKLHKFIYEFPHKNIYSVRAHQGVLGFPMVFYSVSAVKLIYYLTQSIGTERRKGVKYVSVFVVSPITTNIWLRRWFRTVNESNEKKIDFNGATIWKLTWLSHSLTNRSWCLSW